MYESPIKVVRDWGEALSDSRGVWMYSWELWTFLSTRSRSSNRPKHHQPHQPHSPCLLTRLKNSQSPCPLIRCKYDHPPRPLIRREYSLCPRSLNRLKLPTLRKARPCAHYATVKAPTYGTKQTFDPQMFEGSTIAYYAYRRMCLDVQRAKPPEYACPQRRYIPHIQAQIHSEQIV